MSALTEKKDRVRAPSIGAQDRLTKTATSMIPSENSFTEVHGPDFHMYIGLQVTPKIQCSHAPIIISADSRFRTAVSCISTMPVHFCKLS